MKRTTTLAAVSLAMAISLAPGPAQALNTITASVDCATTSLAALINGAPQRPPVAVVLTIKGTCTEDITIEFDDLTLEGDPVDGGTISGTITINGAQRVVIDNLTVTGTGDGIVGIDAAAFIVKNSDIINNEKAGIIVVRSSSAVLNNNTISGNGTRSVDPFIFFDCGLFAADSSSVRSRGNTYADNQYCAIEIDRQASFRNGAFLPREPGHPADPAERDVITERGCDPVTGTGCFTTDAGPVAIEVFNGGLVDLRNADVNGEIELAALSSLRVDGDAAIQGNILNQIGSVVRIRDRSFLGDRVVTYTGTLTCTDTAQAFFSNVQCGQTCSGAIPGTCVP